MDNCSTHHGEEIRQVIEDEFGMWSSKCGLKLFLISVGAKLVYLPPYSPDFNPIEEAFSALKAWLRRHEAQLMERANLPVMILRAALSITPQMATAWFRNAGYV